MYSINETMTSLSRLGLAAAAAAALAACGGGDVPSAVEETRALPAAISGTCAPSTTAGAISADGVVPDLCTGFEQNFVDQKARPSCLDLLGPTVGGYPVKEFGTNNFSSFVMWDENGVFISQAPSFLTVALEGVLGQPLNWSTADTATTDYQVVAVLLKNNSQTHIYKYTSTNNDSLLDPPVTTSNTSWYNVCYVEKPIVTGPPQWCSPGYWKNHTSNWPVALNTTYTLSQLTVNTTPSRCATAPGNGVATLHDVVSRPECYGGEAANLVGDHLSMRAGLNFAGERVENCPLN